jgi:N-acetylmuramoyl-L-alanine amidase
MKLQKLLLVLGSWYLVLGLVGCATVPTKEALPTYNINGITYLSLIPLCDARKINWEYDTFTRTITLKTDLHKVDLMSGESLALIDGIATRLKYPIDIYRGTIVVPQKFKEETLDSLFKGTAASPAAAVPLKIKKIVIDAGHGGTDPGAIGKTGTREKYITLDIAKRLAGSLRDKGVDVVMTRSRDIFIPLPERVDIANNSAADLFVSIHANANRVASLHGFEVYYVSPGVDDSQRAISASTQARLDLDKSCFASDSAVLKAILWDMLYTYDRAKSIELAGLINQSVARNLESRILGVKPAGFQVLKGARMPAILIEVGFLSNYNEERLLKNSYYRQQIAGAIEQGIQNYSQEIKLTQAQGQ